MKTITTNQIPGLKSSKNFELKASKIINSTLESYGIKPINSLHIIDAGMQWGGKGQYKKFIEIEIDDNGKMLILKEHNTDSQMYDAFSDKSINTTTYSNFLKSFILSILESKAENICDEIIEQRQEEE